LAILGIASGPILLIGGALFALVNFIGQPVYGALIADYSPSWLQGRVFGIFFLASFGLSFPGPYFAGFISDQWGTEWIFRLLILAEILIALLSLYLLYIGSTLRNSRDNNIQTNPPSS